MLSLDFVTGRHLNFSLTFQPQPEQQDPLQQQQLQQQQLQLQQNDINQQFAEVNQQFKELNMQYVGANLESTLQTPKPQEVPQPPQQNLYYDPNANPSQYEPTEYEQEATTGSAATVPPAPAPVAAYPGYNYLPNDVDNTATPAAELYDPNMSQAQHLQQQQQQHAGQAQDYPSYDQPADPAAPGAAGGYGYDYWSGSQQPPYGDEVSWKSSSARQSQPLLVCRAFGSRVVGLRPFCFQLAFSLLPSWLPECCLVFWVHSWFVFDCERL